MKWKAALTRTATPELLAALDSGELYDTLCDEIAIKHLHVPLEEIGPATHFLQETDRTISSKRNPVLGVNVAHTMVSVTRNRSDEDFCRALDELQRIYRGLIEECTPVGDRMQLYCALALDGEITDRTGKRTKLLEVGPIWVEGQRPVPILQTQSVENKGGV